MSVIGEGQGKRQPFQSDDASSRPQHYTRVRRRVPTPGRGRRTNRALRSSDMGNLFSWMWSLVFKRTEEWLRDTELSVLQKFTKTSCMSQFIPISSNVEIRTLKFDQGFSKCTPTLVMLHGLGAGLGVWAPCFDSLSRKFPVYALDLPGFGRSTRTPFFGNRRDIEYQFANFLEEWRDAVGLENFVLLGHGFGGYIATLYAIRHPERVRHLILVEPWGYSELPMGIVEKRRFSLSDFDKEPYITSVPRWIRMCNFILNLLDPLFFLRNLPRTVGNFLMTFFVSQHKVAAPTGVRNSVTPNTSLSPPKLAKVKVAPKEVKSSEETNQYLYYCNILKPTGVTAFRKLNLLYFWSVSPLTLRMRDLDPEVPMSFIYGSRSCMDHKTGYEVYHLRPTSYVEVYMVQGAGHDIFAGNPSGLCDIILGVMEQEIEKATRIRSMSSSVASITDELYWDCTWETLNLSRGNLECHEPELSCSYPDVLDDDLDVTGVEAYDEHITECPAKDFYHINHTSNDDSGYKAERFDASEHENENDQVFYPFSTSSS